VPPANQLITNLSDQRLAPLEGGVRHDEICVVVYRPRQTPTPASGTGTSSSNSSLLGAAVGSGIRTSRRSWQQVSIRLSGALNWLRLCCLLPCPLPCTSRLLLLRLLLLLHILLALLHLLLLPPHPPLLLSQVRPPLPAAAANVRDLPAGHTADFFQYCHHCIMHFSDVR
jgi:hypothetical protein